MERLLLDEVVATDYGQFDLVWADDGGFDGDFDRFFAGQLNGLVGAADPHGVYMSLARRSGGSPVRIVRLDEAPDVDTSWEDIVEVSTTIPPGGDVRWVSWAAVTSGVLPGLDPGSYRVRVSARGRDAGVEGEFEDGLVDAYLVQLWSAPLEPDAILQTGSEDAHYWHQEVGGRRQC